MLNLSYNDWKGIVPNIIYSIKIGHKSFSAYEMSHKFNTLFTHLKNIICNGLIWKFDSSISFECSKVLLILVFLSINTRALNLHCIDSKNTFIRLSTIKFKHNKLLLKCNLVFRSERFFKDKLKYLVVVTGKAFGWCCCSCCCCCCCIGWSIYLICKREKTFSCSVNRWSILLLPSLWRLNVFSSSSTVTPQHLTMILKKRVLIYVYMGTDVSVSKMDHNGEKASGKGMCQQGPML